MRVLGGRIYTVSLNVISDLGLWTVWSLWTSPQTWPSHASTLFLVVFCDTLNALDFLFPVSKSRAFLGIDFGFPFLLHIPLPYNHIQFQGFSSHLGNNFQMWSFCPFMYSPNQCAPQWFPRDTPLPLDHRRALRGGRRDAWDRSHGGRRVLGTLGCRRMVPTHTLRPWAFLVW